MKLVRFGQTPTTFWSQPGRSRSIFLINSFKAEDTAGAKKFERSTIENHRVVLRE